MQTFGRYLGVQVIAYGIDLGTFLALGLVLDPLPSNVLSKLAAGLFAFIAHRHVTFKVGRQSDLHAQLVKYGLLLALNIPLGSFLLALLLPWVAPAALAKFLSDVACVGVTFLLSRHVVFVRSRPSDAP